jgi:pyrimidine-nucleoside phosphorylase
VKLIVHLAEKVSTTSRSKLEARLKDGSAWRKFVSLVYAQDGDATTLEKILDGHRVPVIVSLPAKKSGVIKTMDAESIGCASVLLGAGRQQAGDEIDFAIGLSGIKKIGERLEALEPLLFVHAQTDQALLLFVLPLMEQAVEIDH